MWLALRYCVCLAVMMMMVVGGLLAQVRRRTHVPATATGVAYSALGMVHVWALMQLVAVISMTNVW